MSSEPDEVFMQWYKKVIPKRFRLMFAITIVSIFLLYVTWNGEMSLKNPNIIALGLLVFVNIFYALTLPKKTVVINLK